MENKGFETTILVDNTPMEVYNAINNVRGWWSEEIEGSTDKAASEFKYHYKDVHHCDFKIIELVPGEKVVWHVIDNYFNFTKDKNEWKNTDIIFEISRKNNKTELRFTHQGLVPSYECYNVCSEAWGSYITRSLHDLITKGKGDPNPIEEVVTETQETSNRDYTTSFLVNQTPEETFNFINYVKGWWSGEIEGDAGMLGAEFTYQVPGVHWSKQKITTFIPGEKIVWHVLDATLNFVENKNEWKGTDIIFDIAKKGDKTEVRFTHKGLMSTYQCYNNCSSAWNILINKNLRNLITTGQDQPSPW